MKFKFYSFITMMLACSFAFGQSSTIASCGDFEDGPNDTWTDVLVACTTDDGNTGEAQSFTMNVTSLPDGGANYRVAKTVANGNWYFGNATSLTLGENTVTVAGVSFSRTVKFQFSSGEIEFDALTLNGDNSSCIALGNGTAISDCAVFEDGPNATWTDVLVATTPEDSNSSDAQSFTMEVTSLPEGGANYRVVKTVANGNWNNGNAIALTLGTNTKTVPAVTFDRTVKFQFSSGGVEFSSLTLNGEGLDDDCDGTVANLDCAGVDNGTAMVDDCGDCHQAYIYNFITHQVTFVDNANILIPGVDYNPAQEMVVMPNNVGNPYWNAACAETPGCMDSDACNFMYAATEDDGSCVFADGPCDECVGSDGAGSGSVVSNDADGDGICDDVDSCIGSQGEGVRYIDEVFECVDVTSNVVYADNITVLPALQGLPPMPSSMAGMPQGMDIYEPSGDTETDRPLLIYVHTGNFLPPFLNGSAQGTKTDLHAIDICTRFARMGYVVASIDYRLGWNPIAATQEERTIQLIGAAYRGVQDCRTAVRYFRMNAAEMGNEYGIDPGKIGYFGDGTGGYATLAASTISDYNDIIVDDMGAPITKFWYDPGDGSYIPMVIEAIHGDPEAKYDGYAPDGTQLCIGHYPDYSSDVQFNVNLGGALGDHNWLDHGDVPMVTFQCPHDPFAPYTTGVLIVPTTNELVVEVTGGYDIHAEINSYDAPNNNDVFQSANLDDELSQAAIANGGFDGLFPILNSYVDGVPTEPFDSSPWQWWDQDIAQAYDAANGTNVWATQMTLNPTMSEEESNYWLDIIQAYTAPRLALGLGVASAGGGCTDEDACNFNALATEDDGSCIYPDPGYDCEGNSLNIEGCTDAMACDFDPAATVDTGCTYLNGDGIPTGPDNVWLVGMTVTGTSFEMFAAGCESGGGVNPNLSINGVIVGDGSSPLTMAGIDDPTGLLGDLALLAETVEFSGCGTNMTVSSAGNIIPMVGNGQFWISPIPVTSDPVTGAGQYLWAGPMMNFDIGCGNPQACNFSGNPCELSLMCTYPGCTDENADNYNASAGCDDGSCIYLGCTDPDAPNYDPTATDDDGSCEEVVLGCTDINASNWNPDANTDDGSCIVPGCTYADANNYDSGANDDDGSCEFSLGNDCVGDLDGDGVAATSDLLLFLSVFGQPCE